jgi:aryl-alcohol dehydrogenase-like predicted oxidoreductase
LTANVYGWQMGEGITEQIIGRWLSQGGEDVIKLANKGIGRMEMVRMSAAFCVSYQTGL